MRNFEEQLSLKGEEFKKEMESQKDERWPLVLDYLSHNFGCDDDLKGDTEESKKTLIFLKQIWDFGFYSGINFALDPDIPYVTTSEEEEFFNF